jgi:Holliday junction DNA helicase RuvA
MGEATRLRGIASRVAERPAMEGRAGVCRNEVVSPWMATGGGAMIGRLKGVLVHKAPPWLVIDVNGVGYELEAPMSTFYDLPEVGREVSLFTHYAHKEDSVSLYGFLTEAERRLFRDVQKVSGIGARIALAVLSGASVGEFARLVQTGDVVALTRIPGIGKKTAERMVVELRDRAADFGTGPVAGASGLPGDPLSEATTALQALGYKPAEAERMARAARNDGDPAETIIRKALQSALR